MADQTIITAGTVACKQLVGNGETINFAYISIGGAKADADYTAVVSEYQNNIIKLAWTGWTAGHNFILPNIAGAMKLVYNTTGFTATVKTSLGTGVAIANNKSAYVFCDGTNYVRATADA